MPAGPSYRDRYPAAEASELLCWFCRTCGTLGLVRSVAAGYCMQQPRRSDCPVPMTGVPIVEVSDWLGAPDA
jgi:hypothetical protein